VFFIFKNCTKIKVFLAFPFNIKVGWITGVQFPTGPGFVPSSPCPD
jgi:hypothetical protein